MKRGWIFLILPALLGLLLKIAFEQGWLENSVAFLRADLGTLALLLGIILTGLLFIIWGIFLWQDRQFNQAAVRDYPLQCCKSLLDIVQLYQHRIVLRRR